MRSCAANQYIFDASVKEVQHKPLLLFVAKKVIVAKIKLCGNGCNDHIGPPCTVAVDIITPWATYCKRKFDSIHPFSWK
jgi:hypothetical protein